MNKSGGSKGPGPPLSNWHLQFQHLYVRGQVYRKPCLLSNVRLNRPLYRLMRSPLVPVTCIAIPRIHRISTRILHILSGLAKPMQPPGTLSMKFLYNRYNLYVSGEDVPNRAKVRVLFGFPSPVSWVELMGILARLHPSSGNFEIRPGVEQRPSMQSSAENDRVRCNSLTFCVLLHCSLLHTFSLLAWPCHD